MEFFPTNFSGVRHILPVRSDLLSFLFNRYQTRLKKVFFFNVLFSNRNPHSNYHDNVFLFSKQDGFLRFHNS